MKPAQKITPAMFQNSGFYRGLLGDFEVTALNDGNVSVDLEKVLSDAGETALELKQDHLFNPINLSINAFLINTGTRLVLIDTGAGELYGPTSGFLVNNLIASGYKPAQIDTILLTHIHADHSGGLTVAGKKVFPNATIHVNGLDLDYWLSVENEQSVPPTKRKSFQQSRKTVGPYLDSDQIARFTNADGDEIIPGFKALYSPGHTPGHTSILVESGKHGLLLWGDTIHSSNVQLRHPEVTIDFDVKTQAAITSRIRILEWVSASGLLVGADHLSFPGLGHLRKIEDHCYAWVGLQHCSKVVQLDATPYDQSIRF